MSRDRAVDWPWYSNYAYASHQKTAHDAKRHMEGMVCIALRCSDKAGNANHHNCSRYDRPIGCFPAALDGGRLVIEFRFVKVTSELP